jgi:hypothetical protein
VRPAGDLTAWLSGFVAAEGCFTGATTPRGARRFSLAVGLGAKDGETCWVLLSILGVGHVYRYPRRQPHHDDETRYSVTALPDLVEVIVPFMDEHLPPSYKREQYLAWRTDLLEYWETKARRPKPCIVEGCSEPRRAKCLCRHHYYEQYGQ